MIVNIKERKKARYLLLKKIYELTNGNNKKLITENDLNFKVLNLNSELFDYSFNYLLNEQLIRNLADNAISINITHKGIKMIEDSLEQIQSEKNASNKYSNSNTITQSNKKWDIFICHASEDKDEVAEPLAKMLKEKGLNVWFDKFILKLGDSLRRSIAEGLVESQYGIIIISKNFFNKSWPQYELDGLTAKEIEGKKVIIPIWHDVAKEEVLKYSPPLADKLAISTKEGLEKICEKILLLFSNNYKDKSLKDKSNYKKLICNFDFNKIKITQDLHIYQLLLKIKNNSLESLDTFKFVFRFPKNTIRSVSGLEESIETETENGITYSKYSYLYNSILYPGEEISILNKNEGKTFEYQMTHPLYFFYFDNSAVIKWSLYLKSSLPQKEEFNFKNLHIF